jgi:hypothetical protein
MPDHGFKAEPEAAFMCECGASLCDTRVPMSHLDYESGLGPLLADGHGPADGGPVKCSVCGRPGGRKSRQRR